MTFDQGDASGWDECLPSVAACSVKTAAGQAEIPDHGDLWRVEWARQGAGNREHAKSDGDSLNLMGKCFSLPLEVGTKHSAHRNATAVGVSISTTAFDNCGKYAVPWSWAAHPLFVCEKGDRIQSARVHSLSAAGRIRRTTARKERQLGHLAHCHLAAWQCRRFELRRSQPIQASATSSSPDHSMRPKTGARWNVRPAGLRIRFQFDTVATPISVFGSAMEDGRRSRDRNRFA